MGCADSACRSPSQQARRSRRPPTSSGSSGPKPWRTPAISTSTSGSSHSMPREPVRTISTARAGCVRSGLRRARRRTSIGADSDGGRVPRNEDAHGHAPASFSSASSLGGRQPADDAAVQHRRWRRRAQAEAVDRLQRDAAVGAGAAAGDAEPILGARHQRLAAHRLAGLGAAQLEHVAAGRLAAEVVIEGDDAVHLGARQVQRVGERRHGRLGHVAERGLHLVQDLDQRIRPVAVLCRDGRVPLSSAAGGHWNPHSSHSRMQHPADRPARSNRLF